MIIDFHTHTFPDAIARGTIEHLKSKSLTVNFEAGTAADLTRSSREAGIDLSIVLPVVTNPQKALKIIALSAQMNEKTDETGIISFGGIHPDVDDYKFVISEAKKLGLRGLKIHPAYQNTDINDIRYKRIIAYADELGLTVVTHGGIDIGIPGNRCTVGMLLDVIKDVKPKKLVVAHMGGWQTWDEVLESLCGEYVYLDTSFSCCDYAYQESVPINERYKPLEIEKFIGIIRSHGVDKILFGTDSPWSCRAQQAEMIKSLPLSREDIEKILYKNAESLLGL